MASPVVNAIVKKSVSASISVSDDAEANVGMNVVREKTRTVKTAISFLALCI